MTSEFENSYEILKAMAACLLHHHQVDGKKRFHMPFPVAKFGETPPRDTAQMTRRIWLKRAGGAVATGAIGIGIYTRQVEPYWVEVVRHNMDIANLPTSLEGLKLVQISDIHIGDQVNDAFLIDWFKRIAEWKPDIIVFTGDFLTLRRDHSLPVEKMERVLGNFPKGRLATIGILGNHDYGFRWSDQRAADVVVGIARNAGLDILRNETRDVAGLQIVGFDDYWGPNYGGTYVMRDVDLNRPTLALCHNPDVVDLEVWSGYRGWILSGHTHGGQCKLPFLAAPKLPIANKNYASGKFVLPDGRRLYVNRALGHSLKVRFNVRPEVTVFQLTSNSLDQHPV